MISTGLSVSGGAGGLDVDDFWIFVFGVILTTFCYAGLWLIVTTCIEIVLDIRRAASELYYIIKKQFKQRKS